MSAAASPAAIRLPTSVAALEPAANAGIFEPFELHLAATYARLVPGEREEVLVALALAARAPRMGHVCADLSAADPAPGAIDEGDDAVEVSWPDPRRWPELLEGSGLVADPSTANARPLRPLVFTSRPVIPRRKRYAAPPRWTEGSYSESDHLR